MKNFLKKYFNPDSLSRILFIFSICALFFLYGFLASRLELLQDTVMQLTVRTPRSAGLHFLAGQGVELAFDVRERGGRVFLHPQ